MQFNSSSISISSNFIIRNATESDCLQDKCAGSWMHKNKEKLLLNLDLYTSIQQEGSYVMFQQKLENTMDFENP